MIYEPVSPEWSIQQGDIFRCVPRIEISLRQVPVIDGLQTRQATWTEILQTTSGGNAAALEPVAAIVAIKPVLAITITQNCDAFRSRDICLCQVDNFLKVVGQKDVPSSPKKWQSLITRTARLNPKIYYLPEDQSVGISDRMAADFRIIFRVPREDLESMRFEYRIARLNSVATEHFRESLSFFFRRYAYNEWYPLTCDEFEVHKSECSEPVEPFEWQKPK